ncbi:MAG: GSCFA domain-containing protein [Paludibacteraceae bacterium]
MELQTKVHISPSAWQITYQDNSLLLGSCFSDSMAEKMGECYLPHTSNPYGTLYNPLSIAQAMDTRADEDWIVYDKGLYHSLLRHGSFSGTDESEVRRAVAESRDQMRQAVAQATVVIITFGTAWVYEYEGRVVANCHKLPASAFTRRRLTVNEIVAAWEPILERYKEKHFIFTVSPIRHVKDGLHENQLSKGILLAAVEELTRQDPPQPSLKLPHCALLAGTPEREGVGELPSTLETNLSPSLCREGRGGSYFPSYEIVLDELRDYRFYAEDMVHPSAQAVLYVWERFVSTYMSPQTQQDMQTLHRFYQKKHHRLLHPDSEESKRFLQQLAEEEKRLKIMNYEL